jgi:hypothetical protein
MRFSDLFVNTTSRNDLVVLNKDRPKSSIFAHRTSFMYALKKLKILQNTSCWEWPDNADEIIFEVLLDEKADLSDRLIAAELAGDEFMIRDSNALTLLDIVCSEDEPLELRIQSAISLRTTFNDYLPEDLDEDDEVAVVLPDTIESIQQDFRRLYSDPSQPKALCQQILQTSVMSPEDWHQDAILEAYKSKDIDWKIAALYCMQYFEGFDNEIIACIKHENPDVRIGAIVAAGAWSLDEAWNDIAKLLKSKKTPKQIMLAAIESSASIGQDEAIPILEKLAESSDEDIADAAQEALENCENIDDLFF